MKTAGFDKRPGDFLELRKQRLQKSLRQVPELMEAFARQQQSGLQQPVGQFSFAAEEMGDSAELIVAVPADRQCDPHRRGPPFAFRIPLFRASQTRRTTTRLFDIASEFSREFSRTGSGRRGPLKKR
jgi:hypothetical protein